MRKQRILALLLSGALTLSAMPTVFASELVDMPNDWSTTALENAVANGLLQGNNGKIMPDSNLTRAEMATIITRAFAADEMADLSTYHDVPNGAWYEDSLAKAVQMGVLFGSNSSLNPTDAITRQEVFCVLARAFALSPTDSNAVDTFADGADVASWARSSTSAMIEAGFVKGDDNNINPTNNITRKEFATIMDRMVSQYFSDAGTFQGVSQGSVMINTPDVTLKDVTIDGDLIVGDGVGDGDVTLDNVTVEGDILIRGGGENTFRFLNNSSVKGQVNMNKRSGQESTRFLGDKTIELPQINVLGASKGVVLEDVIVESVNVVINKPQDEGAFTETPTETTVKTPVVLKNTSVEKIAVESNKIVLDAINSVIETLVSTGASTTVNVDKNTVVASAVIHGDDTAVTGEGKVSKVETSAANTVVNTIGTDITTTETATGTVASGEDVKPDTSVTTKEDGVVQKPSGGSTTTRPSLKTFDAVILNVVESFDNYAISLLDGKVNMTATDFQYIESFITSSIALLAKDNNIDITGLTVKVTTTDTNELKATLTQSGYKTTEIPLKNVTPKESFTVTFELNGGGLKEVHKNTQVVPSRVKAVLLTEEDFSYIPPDETGKTQLFDQWVDANGDPVTELTVTDTTTLYATYKEDPRSIAQQRIDKGRVAVNNNDPTPITVLDGEIIKVDNLTVDKTSITNNLDILLKNKVSDLLTRVQAWGVYSEINAMPAVPFTSASIKLIYSDDETGIDSTVSDTIASLALNPTEYYTITFEVDEAKGSTVSEAAVVEKGEPIPLPTIIETQGDRYHYAGWTADGGKTIIAAGNSPVATETATYTAVFEKEVIEITDFDLTSYDWVGQPLVGLVDVDTSTPAELANRVFAIWGNTKPAKLFATAGDESPELDVEWTAVENMDSNGMLVSYTLTATATTIPDGYVFANEATSISTDITLNTPRTYTITFDANIPDGESATVESLPADFTEVQNDILVEVPAWYTDPTLDGYVFAGWYTDAACTASNSFYFTRDVITDNTTLYAKWAIVNNGKVVTTVDTSEYDSLVLTAAQADDANVTVNSNAQQILEAFGLTMYSDTQYLPFKDDNGVLTDDEGSELSTYEITWTAEGIEDDAGRINFTLTADFPDDVLPEGYSWENDAEPTVTLTVTVEAPITITGLTIPAGFELANLTEAVTTIDGETPKTLALKVFDAMGVDMPFALLAEVGDNEPVLVEVTWTAEEVFDPDDDAIIVGYKLTVTADDTPSGYVFASNASDMEFGISISGNQIYS